MYYFYKYFKDDDGGYWPVSPDNDNADHYYHDREGRPAHEPETASEPGNNAGPALSGPNDKQELPPGEVDTR